MLQIDLIMCTFNSAKSIDNALISLAHQTWKSYQLIVQDGKSHDDTLERVADYQSVPSWVCSEGDNGIYDAFNRALRRSSGDIVGFLHSDDCLGDENTLMEVAQMFEDPKIVGVFGNIRITKDGRVIRHWRGTRYHSLKTKLGWMPPHVGFYCRRSLYEEIGCFNTDFKISGDYHWFLRLYRYLEANPDKRLVHINTDVCEMKIGGASSSGFSSRITAFVEDYRACRMCGLWPFPRIFLKRIMKLHQWLT